ncbi:MAG: Stk1 family PASTA domain-containing Ser/Thr kinase [Corynebacterium sp.]|nr:Stk1 family PASTA domain-containing Ser/Thr kinase [Corynebacterium sp.]
MSALLVDRYRLGDIIGTGGMSQVYAAEDILLGREVAIKMLREDLALDANFRARFQREAKNSGRLNHPAIVAVYDTGEVTMQGIRTPYIVMELVHGRTLRDIIRTDGALTPEVAAHDLIPVCDALQASHDAGIIHRDIKPGNIMITNTGAVKIMDFGIARALDDATSAMTQTSAVIGTAQYLSPEQARGKEVDGRSDIYALGCVLFECLTGKPPFEGETPFSVAYQHVQEDPPHPSAFLQGLSPTAAVNVDAVVLTAMAKIPADRYQNATEMGEELARLERHAITHAARPYLRAAQTGAANIVRPSEAETTEVPTVATPVAQDEATPLTATHQAVETGETVPKKRTWQVFFAALAVLLLVGGGIAYVRSNNDSATESVAAISIPDVSGQDVAAATKTLEDLGLNVVTREEPSPTVQAGLVLNTNPSASSSVQEGSTVILTVSSGQEMTAVPDLQGLNTEDAARILAESGLALDTVVSEEDSEDVPAGLILQQEPSAGSQVAQGTVVSITVSAGATTHTVPEITGLPWEQASSILNSMGYSATAVMVDSTEPDGTVLAVAKEGQEVPVTETIEVQVSRQSLFTMPAITDMTPEAALAALQAAGWEGNRSNLRQTGTQRTANIIEQGRIAAQGTRAGESVSRTADIEFTVYEFSLL